MMEDKKELYQEMVLPDGTVINLVREINMEIRVNGESAGKVSCTPCDLTELAAGWVVSEGIIRSGAEIETVLVDEKRHLCDLLLGEGSKEEGDTGKGNGSVPVEISEETFSDICMLFMGDPPLRAMTNATHSCMVVRIGENKNLEVLYRSEDAGRHSALDKAIGWAVLNEIELGDCLLMTSGRISTRMTEKASRSGTGALAGKGTVTAEARKIAEETGMTLIGMVNNGKACWFAGPLVETNG